MSDERNEVEEETLVLRFFGDDPEEHTVDLSVLVEALKGLQLAFHLIGMDLENRDLGERARVPEDIARRFAINCDVPERGSYEMRMSLGGRCVDLMDREVIPKVGARLEKCFSAILCNVVEIIENLVRHPGYRLRILKALKGVVPKAGSKYKVGVRRNREPEIILSTVQATTISAFEKHSERREALQTVTGELHRIDFKNHTIKIWYPGTERLLECCYDAGIEELLLENRRGWIQVSGTVVLNEDGEPDRIVDVGDICDLDLSEVEVAEVPCQEGVLRFKETLVLRPETTKSKQLLFVENKELGINVHAATRDELLDELYAQIEMLWNEYGKEGEESLSESGNRLGAALRSAIEEVKSVNEDVADE